MGFGLAKAMLAGATVVVTTGAMVSVVPAAAAKASASPPASSWSSHLSAEQVGSLSAHANQRVIVLLRNQHTDLSGAPNEPQRAKAFAADRAPIVSQLQQLQARVGTYSSVNAIATTVSSAEEANLRKDPAVLAVDPDVVIRGPSSNADLLPAGAAASHPTTSGATRAGAASPAAVTNSELCGTSSAPLLEPEALHLINADNRTNANSPYTSGPLSAHSLGYTGSGVNIAVFPDGMDPTLPEFQRNGHSVVTDFRDFTGEGPTSKTPGGEAFGDVSSLVAQGAHTYNLDQEINPAFATSGGTCDVKVLGVAPGATVDVMKVFGQTNSSFTSEILQGIDWAIQQDHANILSISIGFFALPTSAAEQPLTTILDNAIANGTVVVASTGDASPSNTEESPALDPGVIGAAASTSYRLFAQANSFLYDMAESVHNGGGGPSYHLGQNTPGWLDNQVSTLSSSGVTEERRAPDIIAPGDLNWAVCSTDTTTYSECANALGGTTIGLEDFGGTSESAPLTSGVAALVIQAYRMAHGGQTPTPAVVSQILSSSATDLGVGAEEQGAGLLNALRAVQLAKSYRTTSSAGGLLHSPSSIADLGAVGIAHGHTVTVTNTSSTSATITPALRTLGPAHTLAGGNTSLFEFTQGVQGTCAGIDSAEYYTGETIPEMNCHSFVVPPGVSELDSRIGWNPLQPCTGCTAGPPTAREILIDPEGRYAQYSDPQGDGAGFADEQVHQPAPGTWTLLVFGRATSNYEGPVSYLETAQTFQNVSGAVSPASQVVGAGKTASFTVTVRAPASAGFFTGAVVFNSTQQSALGTIPVVSEAEIAVSAKSPGHFTGTLIGGNGRPTIYAQELSYQFVVPKGVHDVDVNMTSADDGYLLLGQLVDPTGRAQDSQLSFQAVTPSGDNANTHSVQLVWSNPMPGTWKLNVANGLFFLPGLGVYSGLTQSTLNGVVTFNTDKFSVTGMPTGALQPGTVVTAHVKVTNTGAEPETYQLDPRTTSQAPYPAQSLTNTSGTLPVPGGTGVPQYLVPPFSSQLQLNASTTGATPIAFDVSPFWGAPDVAAPPSSAGATGITVNDPIASEWGLTPEEVGPFASTATSENYATSGTLTTLGFDTTASPDTGDLWALIAGGLDEPPNPLFVLPGKSGTMAVTFTVPSGSPGTAITGNLAVETFDTNSFTTGVGDWSSDVLGLVPYSYTLGTNTATSVTPSANPGTTNTPITYTATVTPKPDGGTVNFVDNGRTIPTCGARPVNPATGQAICDPNYVTTGNQSVGAVYSGDRRWVPSTSAPVAEAINPGPAPSETVWLAGAGGSVAAYGGPNHGSITGVHLAQPVVGMAATPDNKGYWLVAKDGGVFAFGDAHFYGSAGNVRLSRPIVGIAADRATGGYWLVASDGGVLSFHAPFFGSISRLKLAQPIVGMAATPDGMGYWLVASDGGVFTFGDARFHGSTANAHLAQPIVGMASDGITGGYWLVASDGGIFTFDVPFFGSAANAHLAQPVIGMGVSPDLRGYWIATSGAGIQHYGDATGLARNGSGVTPPAAGVTAAGPPPDTVF